MRWGRSGKFKPKTKQWHSIRTTYFKCQAPNLNLNTIEFNWQSLLLNSPLPPLFCFVWKKGKKKQNLNPVSSSPSAHHHLHSIEWARSNFQFQTIKRALKAMRASQSNHQSAMCHINTSACPAHYSFDWLLISSRVLIALFPILMRTIRDNHGCIAWLRHTIAWFLKGIRCIRVCTIFRTNDWVWNESSIVST